MKIFILLPRVPYPLEKGDKLRAYHFIKQLSKENEIMLCALNDKKIHPDAIRSLSEYCKEIKIIKLSKISIFFNLIKGFIKGKPLQVSYYYNSKAQKTILNLINEFKPDHIFCQLIRVAEYVKELRIPKTLDYQDVFSKGVERRISTDNFYLKPILKIEYKRLLKYEEEVFNYFDNKTIISFPDRDLIPHEYKNDIKVIPNGVDHSFFSPVECKKEYDLLFTGNMAYPPNINSVEYLILNILPIVLKKKKDLKVLIAGATPSKRILKYRSENIEFTGWVNDIRECYAKSRIFIAPMQIGTGLQNKLLEAMAMKLPCITSKLANNALGAKDKVEILIGHLPEEYAIHIFKLLNDNIYSNNIAINGYNFVKRNYDWDNVEIEMKDLILNKNI